MQRKRLWDKQYTASFCIAFALFALIFFLPLICYGKSPIRTFDGIDQHYLMFVHEGEWLRSILTSIGSSGLTVPMWDTGIGYGGDAITVMGAYVGDPLNLLSVFFSPENAEFGFNLLIVVRFALAGVTFSAYAYSRGIAKAGTLLGAMSYAFSGYMLIVFTEQFFITPAVIFPMLLMGADRVFEHRSPVLLAVAAALFFLTYFYFAYMACLFLVAYCTMIFFTRTEGKKTAKAFVVWALKVFGCVVVGAMIAAVVLLPIVGAMMGQGRLGLEYYSPLLYPLNYYTNFIAGFVSYTYLHPDAFMGFGAVAVVSCAMLFAGKGNRELKIAFIGLTICAMLPILGRLLNGMGYVADRWMFAYALCVCMIVARMLPRLLTPTRRELVVSLGVAIAMGSAILIFPGTRQPAPLIGLGILFGFIAFLALVSKSNGAGRRRGREHERGHESRGGQRRRQRHGHNPRLQRVFWGVTVVFAAGCVCVYSVAYMNPATKSVEIYAGTAWKYQTEWSAPEMLKQLGDDGLWRYDASLIPHVRNNNLIAGLNGFDFYMSIYNSKVIEFENELEFARTSLPQEVSGPDRRSFPEAMLGTRYYIVPEGAQGYTPYGCWNEPVLSREVVGGYDAGSAEYEVYENALALPLAYTFDSFLPRELYDLLSPVQKQQALLQTVALDAEVAPSSIPKARDLEFADRTLPYTITNTSDGVSVEGNTFTVTKENATVELAFEGLAGSETYVEIVEPRYMGIPPEASEEASNGEAYVSYPWGEPSDFTIGFKSSFGLEVLSGWLTYKNHMYGGRDNHIVNLGYYDGTPSSVTLTFQTPGVYEFGELNIVEQPVESLPGLVERRSADPTSIVETTNGYRATVNASGERILFLSIPWSTGWTAAVDGTEAGVMLADTAFMAVHVPAGEHVVELRYCTPYLKMGALASLCGIFVLIVIAFAERRMRRKAAVPSELRAGKGEYDGEKQSPRRPERRRGSHAG